MRERQLTIIKEVNASLWKMEGLKSDFTQKKVNQLISDMFNALIIFGHETDSSDIHIEPQRTDVLIRIRLDGVLQELSRLPKPIHAQLCSKIKIDANIDISQSLLPQDGKIYFQHSESNTTQQVRVSTCPTIEGEKLVLRLLKAYDHTLSIYQLAMDSETQHNFETAIQSSQGLILVTGPTGSGKTSTLYTAIHHIKHEEKNIVTIEDPVEVSVEGINQVSVNPKAGLTFETAIRAFLRQDPDVIMVGEIRDKVTAESALHAAHTGHLVLATVHSNCTCSTIQRLQQLGVDYQEMLSCLLMIINQRLVRLKCKFCNGSHQGCTQCHKGYFGRQAIFEHLNFDTELVRQAIKDDIFFTTKKHLPLNFTPLKAAGEELIKKNITDRKELLRVLQPS